MKKLLFFLASMMLFSCDKLDSEDYVLDESIDLLQTRSSYDTGNVPDIVYQIYDVPVNISLVGSNGSRNTLSASKKGDYVSLYTHDDGSLRQRFLIKSKWTAFNIHLVGGNSSFNDPIVRPTLNTSTNVFYPIYMEGSTFQGVEGGVSFDPLPSNPSCYHINSAGLGSKRRLQPAYSQGSDLVFDNKANYNQTDMWKISLLDDAEILRLRYIKEGNDYIDTVAISYKTYTYDNLDGETPILRELTIDETIKTTSTFTENYGLSTSFTNSASAKVGIPVIEMDLSFSSSYTTTNTWSFSFGKTEEKIVKYIDKMNYTIPPRKYAVVTTILRNYIAQLTYIAEVRERHTGKILYVKGKWNGQIGDDFYLKVSYLNSKEQSINEVEPFLIYK